MRLATDHSVGAYAVSVPCTVCGKMLPLHEAVMDLDGVAFQAYYHVDCLTAEQKAEYDRLAQEGLLR